MTEMYRLTILEAGSLRSKCQQGWMILRPLSWACRWLSSPHISMWSSLCPNLLFLEGHQSYWVKAYPKYPIPKHSQVLRYWELIQYLNLWGTQFIP